MLTVFAQGRVAQAQDVADGGRARPLCAIACGHGNVDQHDQRGTVVLDDDAPYPPEIEEGDL